MSLSVSQSAEEISQLTGRASSHYQLAVLISFGRKLLTKELQPVNNDRGLRLTFFLLRLQVRHPRDGPKYTIRLCQSCFCFKHSWLYLNLGQSREDSKHEDFSPFYDQMRLVFQH